MKTNRNLSWLVWGLMGLFTLVLALPTLRWLVNQWLTNDYYSHGLLVPPIAAYFAWRLWPREQSAQPNNRALSAVAVALLAHQVALYFKAYYLAAFALIALLAALVWLLAGTNILRRIAFPLGFLVFMVPLPFVEDTSFPLQLFTGSVSASIVRFLGVNVLVHGAEVTLPNANLVVGAQCSGLRSIVTLLTLVAIFVFVLQGPAWGKFLLALSAAPIAIIGNLFRVSSLIWVAESWGTNAGLHYYHDYSAPVFFLMALALLILFSRLVACRDIRGDIF